MKNVVRRSQFLQREHFRYVRFSFEKYYEKRQK